MAVLVLGDGNLKRTEERVFKALQRANAAEPAVLLGTEREQKFMIDLFLEAGRSYGYDFFVAGASRNTVENARSALPVVEMLGQAKHIAVTHRYQEAPLPMIHRVERIFASEMPGHTVTLDLIHGIYPRQMPVSILSGVMGIAVQAALERDGTLAKVVNVIHEGTGKLREKARNRTD